MINALQVTNFQSHSASLLTFHAGVNVIVGASDTGKTSLVRALRWTIYNKPGGDEFIAYGETTASVRIQFDDIEITRVKGGLKNLYFLGDTELVGFGQDVPTEEARAINLNEINLQQQLDGSFLLADSAGAVARTLNRIINLDKIDSSLQYIRRLETTNRFQIETTRTKLVELETELVEQPDFEVIDAQLVVLSNRSNKLDQTSQSISLLTELISNLKLYQQRMTSVTVPDVDFTFLDTQYARLIQKDRRFHELSEIIKHASQQQQMMQRQDREIAECRKNLKSLCPNQCPLCGQPVSPTLFIDAQYVGVDDLATNVGRGFAQKSATTNISAQNAGHLRRQRR